MIYNITAMVVYSDQIEAETEEDAPTIIEADKEDEYAGGKM